ncbi:MAG TPA: hypothetical protein VG028_19730 [Terriglobia bacterium]|nr:hypothetical protein [Terriglobia bacterium]
MGEHEMNVASQGVANIHPGGHVEVGNEIIEVTVSYLPAPSPFHHKFQDEATVGTVRLDAMLFFGVQDHKDRDTHEFFLEFEGRRLTNLTETLEQLIGPHRREAHFNLIEQITQGAIR